MSHTVAQKPFNGQPVSDRRGLTSDVHLRARLFDLRAAGLSDSDEYREALRKLRAHEAVLGPRGQEK